MRVVDALLCVCRQRSMCFLFSLWCYGTPFQYDAQGIAYICLDCNSGSVQIPEGDLENLDDAVENCPTSAIIVG
ncbi:ferredoxin [Staphylococcus coagulans]|uniref:ferredoxin n=2 Tax=Staphylococcus coagulans TaxID=74706 RepID=UPI0027BA671A|nr:ferredoxin [Staphylococcus coagulans]